MTDTAPSLWTWLLALLPVAALLGLVLTERISTRLAAAGGLLTTTVVAATWFEAPLRTLTVAAGKGGWLGTWILAVVWPALLLYRVASSGGLDQLSEAFAALLERREEQLLVMAWILPSFVQGVAGFGTPIAVVAPILVALGWSTSRAVLYPLIGYHWSVTFGSMGSSFYMASLTAEFVGPAQLEFAREAAVLLSINAIVAPIIVLALDGGLTGVRRGARLVAVAGPAMAATLILTVQVVPAIGSLAAGAAGLLSVVGVMLVDRRRADRPAVINRGALTPLIPYGLLLVLALPVFLIPASRAWVSSHLTWGPTFPATATGRGWATAANTDYTPLSLLGHPGTYIFAATMVSMLLLGRQHGWKLNDIRALVGSWTRSLPAASVSIVLLAMLALVMVDAGMIATLATGIASVAGGAYPLAAPLIGALGSFMTGSTTSSNALFAALQAQVAELIDVPATILVAGQTVGGNVGNSVAPVVILVGLGALGEEEAVGRVLRQVLPVALGLLALVCLLVYLLAWA